MTATGGDATRFETAATSLSPVGASKLHHVIVSLIWFALSAQWMTVLPIIVPDQIAVMVGVKVLPSVETAGKDMGIWQISMVLPQILAPAVTGWIISAVKLSFGDPTAYATAFGIGALWLILAAALVTYIRLPVPIGNQIRTY
jgi:hypothetical protein